MGDLIDEVRGEKKPTLPIKRWFWWAHYIFLANTAATQQVHDCQQDDGAQEGNQQ